MNRVQAHHSEISPQKYGSDEMDKICLNVGGQKHETYLTTVGHFPDTRLYWIIESVVKSPDYDPDTSEIFFDRHPSVFAQILNYYRTGKLHCPTDVCGPLFEQELNYWGIDEKDMEPCCWANYTQHREAEANLKDVLYETTSEDLIVDSSPVGDPSALTHIWRKLQPPLWAILDESRSSKRAKIFSVTSVLFIVLSVAMFCINTLPDLKSNKDWRAWFGIVESICGIFFTLEFLLRAVFCPGKRAFALKWTTWIDFLAVIPFYLKLVVHDTDSAINVLLVIRLLRLFRFFRLIYGLQVLSHTLKASSYELILLLFMLFIPVVIFSSIVFFIENNLNQENTKFYSIPHSFWWSLITITTVGYGDIHPVSWPGKIVGCMCAICGVLIVALPVSIIGGNFTLFYTHAQARLKLPKRKNKIFLPQTSSAIYSGKRLARTKAIRRKISQRPSESCSMAAYESSRMSSMQGTSVTVNGYPKHVLSKKLSDEESKSMPMRKKVSTVSIKVPLNDDVEENEEKHQTFFGVHTTLSPPEWEYPNCDSVPYVSRRNMRADIIADLPKPDVLKKGELGETTKGYLSDKEKENVDKGETPETTPLLSCSTKPVKPREKINDNTQFGEIILEGDDPLYINDKGGSLKSVRSNDGSLCTMDSNSDRTETKCSRSSSLSFSEMNTGHRTSLATSQPISGGEIEEDSISLDVPLQGIHFNRRRRNPVF